MNTPEDPSTAADDQSEALTDDGAAGLDREEDRSGGDVLGDAWSRSGKSGG